MVKCVAPIIHFPVQKFGKFRINFYLCSQKDKTDNMEATKTTIKQRSREEILTWLQQARERKEAFQRRVNEEWEARQRSKKAAAESGYYDIEWV